MLYKNGYVDAMEYLAIPNDKISISGCDPKEAFNELIVDYRNTCAEDMLEEDIPENNARWEEAYIADGKGSYFNYKFWVSMMNYLRNIVKKGDHSRIELLIDDAEKVFGWKKVDQ